jgi:hypothetical protein
MQPIETDWQYHATIFSHTYRTMDGGTVKAQLIMRRRIADRSWQYRGLTEAERDEWSDRLAY